jgi:SAM-dependent methyltransferase
MSRFTERLKANRRQLEIDVLSSGRRHLFSPMHYSQYRVTLPLARKFIRGRLLDAGCGDLPYREQLREQVTRYDTLDVADRAGELTYVGDIQRMGEVPGDTYDSVICLEVLEHVPDPFGAARELHRVLAPGGVLVASVPHLSRLHDEPHDYYRYTRHGLRHLLEQAGFEIVEMQARGGLFSFFGHQVSTAVLAAVWPIPVVRQLAWELNAWLVTRLCHALDGITNRAGLFAAGYTVVAVKPARTRP